MQAMGIVFSPSFLRQLSTNNFTCDKQKTQSEAKPQMTECSVETYPASTGQSEIITFLDSCLLARVLTVSAINYKIVRF